MSDTKYWRTLTKAQQKSLLRLYNRRGEGQDDVTYRDFRRSGHFEFGRDPAFIVPWCRMFVGIERDGYTHS